jgi:protease-4
VVVLMGDQAASGGYELAAPAQRIVARPTTLTGSIGVWGGKFVMADLYQQLGIQRQAVQRGAMAGFYSETAPFGTEERRRVRQDMGETYERFKDQVARGRGMPAERVEELARGRVWTGAQAVENGLVDALGGFDTALALAKELAGLAPEREVIPVPVTPPRQEQLPLTPEPGAWLDLGRVLGRERVWALAPWLVQVRG